MLFIIYLGSATMLESCKGASKGETVVEEGAQGEYSSDDEIYDDYFESDAEASKEGIEVQDVGGSEIDPEYKSTEQDAIEDYDEDFSYEASEKEKKAINTSTPKPSNKTTTQYTSNDGNYLVVAGSYLIRDNAEKMVSKLKGFGYNGAEIVTFDESQYHSISAGRYSSYDEAGKVARALKNKGIDCYVHTKK